jgi:LysR family nitrogen assimilation transcriptional regulator
VDLGSMTRAAEQLHVAQTALGAQMRRLEEELGTPLLNRHSRGVSATAAGQALHLRALQILELLAQTTREMNAFRTGQTETITLGMSPSLVHLAASDLLIRAHTALPNVALRLVEETSLVLVEALKRGELDMLLAHEVPDNPGQTRTPWLREELLFVTAPKPDTAALQSSWDIVDTIPLAIALETDLALLLRLDGMRKIIATAAEPLERKPRVAFEVQSTKALKLLIADHAVASILPFGLAFPELHTGALAAHRVVDPPLTRTLYMVRTEKRLSESNELALAELLDSIRLRLFDLLGPLASPMNGE